MLAPLDFDLATGTISGHAVLGRSVAAIRSSLGPPSYVEHYARRVDLGYGANAAPRVEVIFNGTAWALEFGDPTDVEAKLGRALNEPPRALQRQIAATYPGAFRLVRPYRCDAKGCFGLFLSKDGLRRVIFGLSRGKRYVGPSAHPSARLSAGLRWVASTDPASTSANPTPIPTVNDSLRSVTPRSAATAGLT